MSSMDDTEEIVSESDDDNVEEIKEERHAEVEANFEEAMICNFWRRL